MSKTEKYLFDLFNETHWPYYGFTETIYILGKETFNELKALKEQNKITLTRGINGILIQVINWETKWINEQSKS